MKITIENIREALMATLNHEEIPPLNLDTHLTDDGILDSLDSLIFFLELEKLLV